MTLQDHAHEYQIAGLQTIPTYNKAPSGVGETNYLNEYKDSDFIDQYFVGAKQMGVVCGEVSGNLVCFDFDQHGETQNVLPTFDAFIADPVVKHLINTKQAALYSSQSGGRHLYVRTPETERPKVLSKYTTGDVMIELRGQGQYMICWPSPGYEHIGGAELIMVNEIDDEAFLHMIELAISFSEIPIEQNTSEREDVERKWGEKWDVNTPDGKYNTEEGQTAYRLLMDAGWSEIEHRRRGNLRYLTRPGKDPREGISATWGYRKNMLYVFSSSVGDFPIPHNNIGKAFNPFDILVRYEYEGDWRKAKDALRELYGMKSKAVLKPIVLNQKEITNLTPFPIEVLPKNWQIYIIELNKGLNYSADILAVSMMSTLAGVIGNKFKLRVKNGWETPMIFWFAVLGNPGTIKSHPVNTAINALKQIDFENNDSYQKQLGEYNMLEESERKKTEKPKYYQTVLVDYTLEALHQLHSYNRRGLILHKDELVGFVKDMNKYREGSDKEFWLESFSNSSFQVIRKTSDPLVIKNICINIIGTIQPKVMTDLIKRNDGDGFVDRFLFTRAETKYYQVTDKEVDTRVLNFWKDYISQLNAQAAYLDEEDTMYSRFTSEGFKAFQALDGKYTQMQNDIEVDHKTRGYISKIRTYTPRFCLMMSLMDHFDADTDQPHYDVEPAHVQRVKKINEYFLNTAKLVFDESEELMDYDEILHKLKGKTRNEKVFELKARGLKNKEIAKIFELNPSRVSQILKQMGNEG